MPPDTPTASRRMMILRKTSPVDGSSTTATCARSIRARRRGAAQCARVPAAAAAAPAQALHSMALPTLPHSPS